MYIKLPFDLEAREQKLKGNMSYTGTSKIPTKTKLTNFTNLQEHWSPKAQRSSFLAQNVIYLTHMKPQERVHSSSTRVLILIDGSVV